MRDDYEAERDKAWRALRQMFEPHINHELNAAKTEANQNALLCDVCCERPKDTQLCLGGHITCRNCAKKLATTRGKCHVCSLALPHWTDTTNAYNFKRVYI